MPEKGSLSLQTHDGVQTFGLKLTGTLRVSGFTNALAATTDVPITFNADDFLHKIPTHIAFKAEAGILTLKWGSAGTVTVVADTLSGKYPCRALFNGDDTLILNVAAESDLEYEIYYVLV